MTTTPAPATIRRYDDAVATVAFDRNGYSPRYVVALHGELIYLYLDTPTTTAPSYLCQVPEGSKFLVGFEATTASMWWANLAGAATLAEAEALLVSMADGNPGKGFIVPAPTA